MIPIIIFEPFVIPFTAGLAVLSGILLARYGIWLWKLPKEDKLLIRRGILSAATFSATGEIFREGLIHRRIFKVNPLLGYMHMSLAFGWFLLIVAGVVEGIIHHRSFFSMPYVGVFFRKLYPDAHVPGMGFVMDFLLLFILSGLALAVIKRFRSTVFGMKRTTKHVVGDRFALTALWAVFPLRLMAESTNSAIHDSGSFLTGSLGNVWAFALSPDSLPVFNSVMWWGYSLALGIFFAALPFSRYTHIFAEIPLVFLRKYGLRAGIVPTPYAKMQTMACSRCGICIDTCQLNSSAGIKGVQSVYFLRNLRHTGVSPELAGNCLLCGRCDIACPVGIELGTLRISERYAQTLDNAPVQYDYLENADPSDGKGTTGYFAGCMGALTPNVIRSMEKVFAMAGEEVWFADRNGGICCGRPIKLSGNTEAAAQMIRANKALFEKHRITTLVTSCPICLKTFREDYDLRDIRVLHHSEYLLGLIESGKLSPEKKGIRFTYHDPCELGRGLSVYEEPRKVIERIGTLHEAAKNRRDALCCGGSLGNTQLSLDERKMIGSDVAALLRQTNAEYIVTGCPLCKKTLAAGSTTPVVDIAEALFL